MFLVGRSVITNGGVEVQWKTIQEIERPELSGVVTCKLVDAEVVVGYQVQVKQIITAWNKRTHTLTSSVHTQKLPRDASINEMVRTVQNLTWCIAECEDTDFFPPLIMTRNPVVINNIGMSLRKQLGLFEHPFLYQATITRLQQG